MRVVVRITGDFGFFCVILLVLIVGFRVLAAIFWFCWPCLTVISLVLLIYLSKFCTYSPFILFPIPVASSQHHTRSAVSEFSSCMLTVVISHDVISRRLALSSSAYTFRFAARGSSSPSRLTLPIA